MSRQSTDEIKDGRLINGFDYINQAWVRHGVYVRCGHPAAMECGCYGRTHEGEETKDGLGIWVPREYNQPKREPARNLAGGTDMKQKFKVSEWRKMQIVAEATYTTTQIRIDDEAQAWAWVSGGKYITAVKYNPEPCAYCGRNPLLSEQ